MKIVLAGGSGFMGRSLIFHNVSNAEWEVFSRGKNCNIPGARVMHWDGKNCDDLIQELEGADVLINLSGKSVDCRYNANNMAEIYASRLESTKALGEAMLQCKNPPSLWLNAASATIYRHAEDRAMDEFHGEYGTGFSVDVCQKWESMFFGFQVPGVRQVAMRTAIVLGREGGVLIPLKNLTRLGLGGAMGSGKQMFSWIHEKDLARAVDFVIRNQEISGPVNFSAPGPVTNTELMRTLRHCLNMPLGLHTPEWLLKLGAVLIRTETELILKSRWVLPSRLLQTGFEFEFPEIKYALEDLTGHR